MGEHIHSRQKIVIGYGELANTSGKYAGSSIPISFQQCAERASIPAHQTIRIREHFDRFPEFLFEDPFGLVQFFLLLVWRQARKRFVSNSVGLNRAATALKFTQSIPVADLLERFPFTIPVVVSPYKLRRDKSHRGVAKLAQGAGGHTKHRFVAVIESQKGRARGQSFRLGKTSQKTGDRDYFPTVCGEVAQLIPESRFRYIPRSGPSTRRRFADLVVTKNGEYRVTGANRSSNQRWAPSGLMAVVAAPPENSRISILRIPSSWGKPTSGLPSLRVSQ